MNNSISILSCETKLAQVQSFVKEIAFRMSLEEAIYHNIYIAITEAVNNAIIHGNEKDRTKKVNIYFEELSDKLKFLIEDEGCGFSPDQLIDPTSPENITKPTGRGVFIMKHLSEEMNILQDGCCIELIFKRN